LLSATAVDTLLAAFGFWNPMLSAPIDVILELMFISNSGPLPLRLMPCQSENDHF